MSDEPDSFDRRVAAHAAMSAAKQASDALNITPASPANQPHGDIPNTMLVVVSIAFALGAIFATSVIAIAVTYPGILYQLSFVAAAWSFFHFMEFAVTAGWNREKLSVDSFLLNNGKEYHVAHAVAVLEWLLTRWLRPDYKTFPYVSEIGIALTLLGQLLRSLAMIHAASNFSHLVAYRKAPTHQLVTDGVYSWSRHPSYTGFFYWGLGMQLTLQNPVSFVAFAIVLWRFFNSRIRGEEALLVRFFGEEYQRYRQRVGTKIPFIR
ncbi:ICMT-domain-containing protein [Auriculariales sp. MPI-PUGE-AT-0066]|nr:ICMT-domain-containing protein [Auriculariales sp. MPI-PUGE-AT-0066]